MVVVFSIVDAVVLSTLCQCVDFNTVSVRHLLSRVFKGHGRRMCDPRLV